jgi:hypothetical protein
MSFDFPLDARLDQTHFDEFKRIVGLIAKDAEKKEEDLLNKHRQPSAKLSKGQQVDIKIAVDRAHFFGWLKNHFDNYNPDIVLPI